MSISFVASCQLPTPYGNFDLSAFEQPENGKEYLALAFGDISGPLPVLTRLHSECLTGDALFSLRCDCGAQLKESMRAITAEGRGIILYLRQEGRDIGLANKIRAYALQDQGADTVEANEQLGFAADLRQYSMCVDMLRHLNVARIRLMTNNPAKLSALQTMDIEVVERVPLHAGASSHNHRYMATKFKKLGHICAAEKEVLS